MESVVSWILMSNGKPFDFEAFKKTTPYIETIAHSLSLLCRYNGHCKTFYSVAEHSVRASFHVPREFAFEALLHDAAEAFVGDVTRPLKAMLGESYKSIERQVEEWIAEAYRLRYPWPDEVHEADIIMLAMEKRDLLPAGPRWELELPPIPKGCGIPQPWSPDLAEAKFMSRFGDLAAERWDGSW